MRRVERRSFTPGSREGDDALALGPVQRGVKRAASGMKLSS